MSFWDDLVINDADSIRTYHTGTGRSRAGTNKEFVAWDGEGITPSGERQQNYVLFGNSKGFEAAGYSLDTKECFRVMLDTERAYPNAIHVGFAFSYDVEMILKDIPVPFMRTLKNNGYVYWEGFRIEYRRNKWFQVTLKNDDEHVVCRIWDVWSFFSTSFVVALREYLGNDPEVEYIEAGKSNRSVFQYAELDTEIRPYWQAELRQLVNLMNALRERLYGADLKITNWHGPGAIATYAMTQRGVKKSMATIPDDVSQCSRFAYAGGRFELFRIGQHKGPVHAYDIRSAYPSAIQHLPNLATGEWSHVTAPTTIAKFGMYRIRFNFPNLFTTRPMPLYYRDVRSAVHFPNVVEGWYWSPEAQNCLAMPEAEIVEGWEYHADEERPFTWIGEVYEQRAQWKREGNPSQIALKLLMNSMYGKFAQRVGYKGNDSPTWHQLEWAGFITSYARAKLFRVMMEAHNKGSLLAVETDGIFSTEPLSTPVLSENLGDWEHDEYEGIIYLQSGFYFKKRDGQWSAKSRGFDKGSITVDDAIASLGKWRPWQDEAPLGEILGQLTRFTTMGQYLQMHKPEQNRRVWETQYRELRLGTDGKRIHRPLFCRACALGISPVDALHDMTIWQPVGGHTYPHILPWIDKRTNTFREMADREGISHATGR